MRPIPRKNLSTKSVQNRVYTGLTTVIACYCVARFAARFRGRVLLPALAFFVIGLVGCGDLEDATRPAVVRISAAASIAPTIETLSQKIEEDLNITIEVNAGGSGILAQQISRGDRVDLFISADTLWMDRLEAEGLIETSSRTDLAGNRLVLIGLKQMDQPPAVIGDLADPRYQPIAAGDPAYVPAGRYARQVFQAHGLDSGDGLRLAEAPNVRAAVAYVAAGQCPVGLVYVSDVRADDRIEVLFEVDPQDHDPIRYPAAVLKQAPNPEQAQHVLNWLRGEQARDAFNTAGFMRLESNADKHVTP